jgi:hypothetical protein
MRAVILTPHRSPLYRPACRSSERRHNIEGGMNWQVKLNKGLPPRSNLRNVSAATECDKHQNVGAIMRQCAEACRKAAEACRKLATP